MQCTVSRKSHDPCFHVFLMEAGVMTFVGHCTQKISICVNMVILRKDADTLNIVLL